MKKLLLTLTILFSISLSSYAQNWDKIYSDENINIETKVVECNPHNKQYPFSYIVLRYTNKTNQEVDFNFEFELEYNGVIVEQVKNDLGDEAKLKKIHLNANEVREGSCGTASETYKIFYKTSHPKLDNRLTNIKIITK